MITAHEFLLFALASLLMVLTPGPNMMYLVSRSLSQGWRAAAISLGGVACGFLCHLLLAVFGLSVVLLTIPWAYDGLKLCGAAYLLWLAWQAVRSGGTQGFQTKALPADSAGRLFGMGFLTNALNPKIALFYLSVFSSFLLDRCSDGAVAWAAAALDHGAEVDDGNRADDFRLPPGDKSPTLRSQTLTVMPLKRSADALSKNTL